MSKEYVLVGRDLGLLHPAIEEFYSIPHNIERTMPGYRPSRSSRYALMHGWREELERFRRLPPYYFVLPLEEKGFSRIRGTGLDAVLEAAQSCDIPGSLLEGQWMELERFELYLNHLHLFPAKYEDTKPKPEPRKRQPQLNRVSRKRR